MAPTQFGSFPHSSGTHFSTWAPEASKAAVKLEDGKLHPMERGSNGFFHVDIPGVGPGARYWFVLDDDQPVPDIASRSQPDGNDGASEVVDLSFAWTDDAWRGVSDTDQIVYELHIGTFTQEGTWASAAARLQSLKDLGVTVMQIMPVGAFKGRFGWGYDTTFPYAPYAPYGTAADMQHFVDRAHALGIGVILDVVYNHAGNGEHYKAYGPHFFTDRYENEWGGSFNFDGDRSRPVRDFFIENARSWIADFHLDGLRIDAVQALFDASDEHILTEITRAVREAGGERRTYMVVENQPQERSMIEPPEQGGRGVDAMYNDDFHHAVLVAATGRNDFYYRDYSGTAQEIASALKYGFLYHGQRSNMRNAPYGTYNLETHPRHFLHFLENHDQVANSARGYRLGALTSPARLRAISTLMLLGPQTPCLFQGQEFSSSRPFLYFLGLDGKEAEEVAKGRREGLCHFSSVTDPVMSQELAEPSDPQTFARSKLDWQEVEKHFGIYALHKDLIALRKTDPSFSQATDRRIETATLSETALLMRIITPDPAGHRLLLVNLGRDLPMANLAQPLLAPADGQSWQALWSSEHPRYGGSGRRPYEPFGTWTLASDSALLLGAVEREKR